jgi:hypothetical protein
LLTSVKEEGMLRSILGGGWLAKSLAEMRSSALVYSKGRSMLRQCLAPIEPSGTWGQNKSDAFLLKKWQPPGQPLRQTLLTLIRLSSVVASCLRGMTLKLEWLLPAQHLMRRQCETPSQRRM